MKRKIIKIPFIIMMIGLFFIVIFHACNKDFSRLPSVVTDRVDKASSFAYGKIVDIGSGEISDYGFCWDTLSLTPDISASTLKLGPRGNTGTFQGQLPGLRPSKTYHLRAFLMNSAGVIYGKTVDFITPDLPTLTTAAITNITPISAISGGNITSDGGSPVTARGVCYSINQWPDLNSAYTIDSSGAGEFISSLTGLTPDTKYYVRAYATSIYGTTYGGEVSFTAGQPITSPVVTTAIITSITQNSAQGGGEVVSDGGATVTERGVCFSANPSPTIADPRSFDGSGTGVFTSYITSLNPNTLYYVRAYATNSAGTAYGNEVTFTTLTNPVLPTLTTTVVTNITQTTATSGGNITSDGGATVTARGVCWNTTGNPTLATCIGSTSNGSGNGVFVSNLTGLTMNTFYYVRSYATNGVGTAYGNEVTFSTLTNPVLPSVTTTAVTNITSTTATSGGNVTSSGGATVTARGVCWSTSHNPTTANSHTSNGSGTGSFMSSITGLSPGTTYYVRAYATNTVGIAYGNEVSFTTSSAFYIGQNYGGGIIFYIDGTGQHGLIAATSDQSTWAQWGCYYTPIGTSTAIGTGQANTTAIVNICSESGIAARICNDLVLNGYNDWFLPSKDELNLMYEQKSVIGGFSTDGYYWSSSEPSDPYAAYFAWDQYFSDGDQSYQDKRAWKHVRAVRAF